MLIWNEYLNAHWLYWNGLIIGCIERQQNGPLDYTWTLTMWEENGNVWNNIVDIPFTNGWQEEPALTEAKKKMVQIFKANFRAFTR